MMVLSGRVILSTTGGYSFPAKKARRLCSDSNLPFPKIDSSAEIIFGHCSL
jgi:hypothetical protein